LTKTLFDLDPQATLEADQYINLATQFFVALHRSMWPIKAEPH
jgi:hypothetical protein